MPYHEVKCPCPLCTEQDARERNILAIEVSLWIGFGTLVLMAILREAQ